MFLLNNIVINMGLKIKNASSTKDEIKAVISPLVLKSI
jgi:hypothetical protein